MKNIKIFKKNTIVHLMIFMSIQGYSPFTFSREGDKNEPPQQSLSNTDVAESQLTLELFKEIEYVAERFVKKYPPNKYYYFGLGRSPHSILAYIDALKIGDVRYIPISNAKWHFENPNGENTRTLEREELTRNHFQKFLPTDAELNGRQLLVIDFVDTGEGFRIGMYYALETFFEMGRNLDQIHGVGLHMTSTTSGEYYRNKSKQETVTIRVDKFSTYKPSDSRRRNPKGVEIYGAMVGGQEADWLTTFSPVGRYDFQTMEKDHAYSEKRQEYQILLNWIKEMKKVQETTSCRDFFN